MRTETETRTFISPSCPTCGKEMKLTGLTPTCDGVIYDFVCTKDKDSLSWRPRRVVDAGTRAQAISQQA
jgi:hypothetical protein